MNRLNFSFDVKSKQNGSIVIAGYANANTIDRGMERIEPKAWRLDDYKKNPVILFDHGLDPAFGNLPIGKARKVEIRDDGLYCEVEISNSKTEKISAVRDLIEEGILKTFSVGFDPKEHTKDGDIKVITDANLLEISTVPLPMNQDSTFGLMTKSLSERRTKTAHRWFERYKKNFQTHVVAAVKNSEIYDNLDLVAISVSKEGFKDLEKAKKFLVEKKYLVEKFEDEQNCWKFIQKNCDNDEHSGSSEIISVDLTPHIKALIRGKKAMSEEKEKTEEEKKEDQKECGSDKPKEKEEKSESEKECVSEKPEGEEEKSEEEKSESEKENKGVIPTGSDAVDNTTNPLTDLSKQTNVLLGVVIEQLQRLNQAMEKFVEIPVRAEEQEPEQEQEQQQEQEQEQEQEGQESEEEQQAPKEDEEDGEEMRKCIEKIRKNQEDLNLRLKSLIN